MEWNTIYITIMANHNGTVGKEQVVLVNSENESIVGDGEIVPVKWEGSCPEDYGEVVRAWPKLVRTNN